jgi:hypothetical protein
LRAAAGSESREENDVDRAAGRAPVGAAGHVRGYRGELLGVRTNVLTA